MILDAIRRDGPMPLSRYMDLCLSHPEHGYYTTRDPLGAKGDFVTAPEISQMFGELIGLWIVDVWDKMGRPTDVKIVELGPGRGTLMADALRTFKAAPEMSASLYCVEISPVLRAAQQARLTATWLDEVDAVPPGPMIVIANEFFDALPIDQIIRQDGAWRQIVIGENGDGQLERRPGPSTISPAGDHSDGTIIETSPATADLMGKIASRLVHEGGAALIIDYGPAEPATGDTLQALHNGTYANPLDAPGAADLTAHVNFPALRDTALSAGAIIHGPVPQAAFLEQLGLFARADTLKQNATPDQRRQIDLAAHRLTAPDQMGTLFKALAITAPGLASPAGFAP